MTRTSSSLFIHSLWRGGASFPDAETECFHVELMFLPVKHFITDRAVITQFD
jgi:hypothetical protein